MPYYVYILQSNKDGSYYVGSAVDANKRLSQHNKAKSGYIASKKPWKLVHFEKFKSKEKAVEKEHYLKRQKSALFYQMLIESSKK